MVKRSLGQRLEVVVGGSVKRTWGENWKVLRTDGEAETPILWPPDENCLIAKDPDAGKD